MKFSAVATSIKRAKNVLPRDPNQRSKNLELLYTGIGKECHELNIPNKCHQLIGKIACDPVTEQCANGECESCP